jgi:hypothetical protein
MTTLHETAEYLRRMGEPPSSVDYLLRQSATVVIDPRGVTMEQVAAVLGIKIPVALPPATNTGD